MAADYQLTAPVEPCAVIRHSDGACIPPDMANRDYNGSPQSPGYLQWLEDGGVPDPVPPIVVATLNSVGNARTAAQILGAA